MDIQTENAVTFDVEMTDYNEMTDETTIRVSSTNGNVVLATGVVSYGDDDISGAVIVGRINWTDLVKFADMQPHDTEQLTKDVLDAIQSEFDAHHEAQNLRDLLAVVVPSGVTTPRAAGLQL